MKIDNFLGDLTDVSAKKEPVFYTRSETAQNMPTFRCTLDGLMWLHKAALMKQLSDCRRCVKKPCETAGHYSGSCAVFTRTTR